MDTRKGIAPLLAFTTLLSAVTLVAQEPRVIEQHANFGVDAPASLDQHVGRADAIVRGKITARETIGIPPSSEELRDTAGHRFEGMPHVVTRYTVTVDDVLKEPKSTVPTNVGSTVTVFQSAGELQWKEYLIRANAEFPLLAEQREYILFLRWSEPVKGFVVAPQGVFKVTEQGVQSPSKLPVAIAVRGQPAEAFAETVRKVANSTIRP